MTDDKKEMTESAAKQLRCSVRYLTAEKVKAEDTVEKWLANFRDARYVITDSYHGTVFSLIFQKQFYTFYNTYRGNARMDSLKEISGLEDRFVTETTEELEGDVDFAEVEEKIVKMRIESEKFLKGQL